MSIISQQIHLEISPSIFIGPFAIIPNFRPFCKSICPYCDFNRYLHTDRVDEDHLFNYYQKEFDYFFEHYLSSDMRLLSVLFLLLSVHSRYFLGEVHLLYVLYFYPFFSLFFRMILLGESYG